MSRYPTTFGNSLTVKDSKARGSAVALVAQGAAGSQLTSVFDRKNALLIAAELIERVTTVDATGEEVTALRAMAYAEDLKVLRRGDFVRLVNPPAGNEEHTNAVVVVTDPTIRAYEGDDYPDSFLTVLIPGDGFLQVQRKELGQPLDVDDDGEKLIVG